MSAYAMAGNTPLVVQPMIVGAMVDLRGFTERQAGIVAAVELTGLTLGILTAMLLGPIGIGALIGLGTGMAHWISHLFG